MDSTVSHDELSSKLKLAVLGVISSALAGEKGRIIQYPIQFFRITHNLNTVALMMKFCSTWALGQIDIAPTPGARVVRRAGRRHAADATCVYTAT